MQIYDYMRPCKVMTPISKDDPTENFERLERFAARCDVVVLWAFGCDAAVIFGREADVMEVIRYAYERYPGLFRASVGDA